MNSILLLKSVIRWLRQGAFIVFLILNILAFTGAFFATHFKAPGSWGLGLPRPTSTKRPSDLKLTYVTQRMVINQTEWLETWFIPVDPRRSKGTVILFPGNGGSKAGQLLAPSKVFHELSYDTLLVDFRGVGGSSGNTTTLGDREAQDVALVMNYVQRSQLKQPIILYGVSMGSAAVLKAVAQYNVKPDALILELPFARLLDATRSRLKASNLFPFPMAELTVFWGSIQHRFNGFTHNPVIYAEQVNGPTLVLQGKQDRWTTEAEIKQILAHLKGPKQLILFPQAGHDLLVTVDRAYWKQSVDQFLRKNELEAREDK